MKKAQSFESSGSRWNYFTNVTRGRAILALVGLAGAGGAGMAIHSQISDGDHKKTPKIAVPVPSNTGPLTPAQYRVVVRDFKRGPEPGKDGYVGTFVMGGSGTVPSLIEKAVEERTAVTFSHNATQFTAGQLSQAAIVAEHPDGIVPENEQVTVWASIPFLGDKAVIYATPANHVPAGVEGKLSPLATPEPTATQQS